MLPHMAKKDFANEIKELDMGRLSWIMRVGPEMQYTYPYKRVAERVHTAD